MAENLPSDLLFDNDLINFVEQSEASLLKNALLAANGESPASDNSSNDQLLDDSLSLDLDVEEGLNALDDGPTNAILDLLDENERLLSDANAWLRVDGSPLPDTDQEESDLDSIMSSPSPSSSPFTPTQDASKGNMAAPMTWPTQTGSGTPVPATPGSTSYRETTTDDDDSDNDDDDDKDINDDDIVSEQQGAQKRQRVLSKDEEARNELELLQKEAKYLAAQCDFLLSRNKSAAEKRAAARARRRAGQNQLVSITKTAEDNAKLHELLEKQKVYVENFRAMLAFAPVNDIRLSLMTPMDLYVHLGVDAAERRKTILSLRETKLDLTYKYLEQKARGLNVNEPHYYCDVFEKFGKVYSASFSISKFEGVDVQDVVQVIHGQTCGADDNLAKAMGCLTVREEFDKENSKFVHQRMVSTIQCTDNTMDKVPAMESNGIFYSRHDNNIAILAAESVDQDDLHPYSSTERIRKDVSSGVVLTSHVDENGVKGVVMKRFFLAKFHVHPVKVSQRTQEMLLKKIPVINQRINALFASKATFPANMPPITCG